MCIQRAVSARAMIPATDIASASVRETHRGVFLDVLREVVCIQRERYQQELLLLLQTQLQLLLGKQYSS